ncbi:MAG: FKBP-type peptidyl-prolyl cis-trans isomerase [Candidatus Woesearchaeota archaeon]
MAKRKKNKALLWIVFAIIVIGGLWYYYKIPKEAAPEAKEAAPKNAGVQMGDLVRIRFVLSMTNGTVVDTTDPALAREYNISAYSKDTFRFIVGQSGKLKGFDEAMVGLEPGNFTRIIPPSEPVMQYVMNRTRTISRNQPIPRYQPFTLSAFEKYFRKKPVIGDVVSNPEFPWPYKVVNITENNAVCDPVVTEGKSYQLPGLEWKSLLLVVAHNSLAFRHNPTEGQIIKTEFGPAVVNLDVGRLNITYQAKVGDIVRHTVQIGHGAAIVIPQTFQVTDATDKTLTITRINYPAQETLVLKGELIEWEKGVKEVKGEPIGETKVIAK